MSRVIAASLGLAALAFLGCGNCDDLEGEKISLDLAKFNYDNGKFDQAKILYSRATEQCLDDEEAVMGLAHSCREYGSQQFRRAADLAAENKLPESKKVFREAAENHALCFDLFQRRLIDHPDELGPHYGLALLYYQRSTSVFPFPFPIEDTVNRQRERDLAITEFELITKKSPTSWQAHRYLGLALFSAGRMDEGVPHLRIFHDAQQTLYERVLLWPGTSDDEKKRKEASLRAVEKEVASIREVLGEYFMTLQRDRDKLAAKKAKTPEEDNTLARSNRELLVLESIIKNFHLTNLGPIELEVQRRCQELLESVSRGRVDDVMSMAAMKPGDEAAFKRRVQDKIDQGLQYRRPRYRTIVVSGDVATVGMICDVINSKGTRTDAEVTMHWRLSGGQWKVSELP